MSEYKGNNYILVIFDSCRFDTFTTAAPKTIAKLGEVEKRWSYASWTAPSHYNLLMGLLPHHSPQNVFASEYYKKDFLKYNERLGQDNIEFKSFVPRLFLPAYLQQKLNYRTHAMMSLPVLNPRTIINQNFDTFRLMDSHNDMRAIVRSLKFSEDRPSFYILNVGETHYPYALPDEPRDKWPRVSGVHGVFKHLDDDIVGGKIGGESEKFFDQKKLDELQDR